MSPEDITLREFRSGDLSSVDPDSFLIGQEKMLCGYNTIYTFELLGTPIACAGLVLLWPGVAEAWTVLSNYAKVHPLWIIKALRRELRIQIAVMNLWRVQMHVEDAPLLLKWGKLLGFEHEGTLRKYTKEGKTLHMLAFIP